MTSFSPVRVFLKHVDPHNTTATVWTALHQMGLGGGLQHVHAARSRGYAQGQPVNLVFALLACVISFLDQGLGTEYCSYVIRYKFQPFQCLLTCSKVTNNAILQKGNKKSQKVS